MYRHIATALLVTILTGLITVTGSAVLDVEALKVEMKNEKKDIQYIRQDLRWIKNKMFEVYGK